MAAIMNLGLGLMVALSSCWEVSGQSANYTFAAKTSMSITGLNYTELETDAMKLASANDAIKSALVELMGTHVEPWIWNVVWSPGFVVLEMNLPDSAEQATMEGTFNNMKDTDIPNAFKMHLMAAENLTFTGDVMVEVNKVWKQEYNDCDFSLLGWGYCADDAATEMENRLSDDWVLGEIDAAEAACCSDEFCAGFQLDLVVGDGKAQSDFVLLHAMGTPNGEGGMRRMCFQKTSPAVTAYVPTDGAIRLSIGGLALALGLAVAY